MKTISLLFTSCLLVTAPAITSTVFADDKMHGSHHEEGKAHKNGHDNDQEGGKKHKKDHGNKASKAHWGYDGNVGPAYWAKLDSAYTMCDSGTNQSPVNLTGFVEAELPPLTFNYASSATDITNNGHTVKVSFAPGSTVTVDGKPFELSQFHFHTPSENQIDGKTFPMEAHFVHRFVDENKQTQWLAIAVMFEEGDANLTITDLWKQIPQKVEDKMTLTSQVNGAALLPENRDYYRFSGSFTTPPCTEGIRWIVMKTPLMASKEQMDAFTKLMGGSNNRPVQPLNARVVLK